MVSTSMDTTFSTFSFRSRILTRGYIAEWLDWNGYETLPTHDRFGYEMGYFPIRFHYAINGEISRDTDGEMMYDFVDGDVVCGWCAAHDDWSDGYYVAYQINGEIGDMETVRCVDCDMEVYSPFE